MRLVPNSTRVITFTWLGLLALTLGSFASSEAYSGRAAAVLVLLAAAAKSSLVAFQFMDLRVAHLVWKAAFVTLLAIIVLVLWVMRPPVL